MFIIRRKSDGLYFSNGPRKWVRDPTTDRFEVANRWVDDPSKCKPFLTRQSASRSQGMQVQCPYPMPNWRDGADAGHHALQLAMRRDWFDDKKAHKKLKYETYEIIEVEVKIKPSNEVLEDGAENDRISI